MHFKTLQQHILTSVKTVCLKPLFSKKKKKLYIAKQNKLHGRLTPLHLSSEFHETINMRHIFNEFDF